jgi:hypothetical protein
VIDVRQGIHGPRFEKPGARARFFVDSREAGKNLNLTETAPAITVNTFEERKFGFIGVFPEGVEIKAIPGSDANV